MRRLFCTLAIAALWSVPAYAAESVSLFDTIVYVEPDSSLRVTEWVTYDFGDAQRHGIERIIPKRSEGGPRIVITDVQATRGGDPEQVNLKGSSDELRIRVGDPDTLITGVHSYALSYVVLNAVRYYDDRDEVYWNAIPQDMRVPITESRATIVFPDDATITGVPACYTGAEGSVATECRLQTQGSAVYATAERPFGIGEGMTLSAAVVPGVIVRVAPVPEASSGIGGFGLVVLGGIGGTLALLVAFGVLVRRFSMKLPRRRRDGGDIIVQYDAPEGLSAARCGHLAQKGDAFTAAILQLAVNGWLQLTFTKKQRWLGSSLDISFMRRKSGYPEDLFDRQILDIVTPREQPVTLADIKRRVRAGELVIGTVLHSLNDLLVREGILERTGPLRMFTRFTQHGRDVAEHVAGLRIYLSAAEKERLAFHNAPERSPQTFEALLPYAVALGVDKAWREQFADVYHKPEWVRGDFDDTFTGLGTALTQLGSDLRSSVNAYESGSGGGGSSGGGSGGGGGGSW